MELNAEQIIKALECCIDGSDCTLCPLCDEQSCPCVLNENALALIKELTEENERLMREKTALECVVATARNQAKADTVRKMQEQLKMEIDRFGKPNGFISKECVFWFIDQIAKEILEGG